VSLQEMIYNKHGNLVRIFYLLIALFFYAASFGGYLKRKRSIVLCYHGILAGQKRLFRWQIERVATQNRPTFWWKKSPTVSITFDDAFDNLIENAIPALIEFNVSALIFAISKNLGNTPQWKISKNHPEYQERTMTATKLNIISKIL
jgi:peptidoglycan/xylan/chitin deacetylase (PgdA/CDA1 family)